MTMLLRRSHHPRGTQQLEILNRGILASSLRVLDGSNTAIDTIIVSALRELSRIEGADQASFFGQSGRYGTAKYSTASSDEVIRSIGKLSPRELPWCRSSLRKGRAVILRDLNELPPVAHSDREYLERLGVQSIALVPINEGNVHRGTFALVSVRRTCDWSESLLMHCALVGSMLMGAHAATARSIKRAPQDSYFREIFDSAAVGMAIEQTSGRMLFVNDALCRMFGYSEPEMLGMTCRDFSHPDDYEREYALFKKLLDGKRRSYEIEKRFFHRDGSIVWGRVNVTLLRDYPNGLHVVLGIVEDITTQKDTLEKLVTSQKEVESLASRLILSQEDERRRIARELHDDIGQRLSIATSQAHVLGKPKHKNDRSRVRSIASLAKDLDALVSDIHGLSHRLHSSQLQHLGIAAALRDLCRQMRRSGLDVDLTIDEELEPVRKDITLCLYRIAQEALINTLNHSGETRATITVSKGADGYSMSVKDMGKGFRVDSQAQGLGLISMRERLKPLNGQFTVRSSPGHGTQIVVTIPRKDEKKRGGPQEAA